MDMTIKSFFSPGLLLFACTYVWCQNKQAMPSWAMGPFVRPAGVNPILVPNAKSVFTSPFSDSLIRWEENDVFNPGAVVSNNKVVLLYRAEDKSGTGIGERTSRIGYASSSDGVRFDRRPTPVLFPANDSQKEFEAPGGCEDPRVSVTEDGTYVVFYTQWNKQIARLGVATSTDLLTWKKHGPIFRSAHSGRFHNNWSKSASILTALKNGKQVVAKMQGKYWMYWGEHRVYAATSTDLVNWEPLLNDKGGLRVLAAPRKGYFDSRLTECGPPAVLTGKGILLVYNGKNAEGADGDPALAGGAYAAGQLLFDRNEPTKLLGRLDKPFFVPEEPFEKSGQYPAGTVFTEGLVYFGNKWFLYYGCADSRVGVAVFDPQATAGKQNRSSAKRKTKK